MADARGENTILLQQSHGGKVMDTEKRKLGYPRNTNNTCPKCGADRIPGGWKCQTLETEYGGIEQSNICETNVETNHAEVVEDYIRSLDWSHGATEMEKTLVAGNLRGFWVWLKQRGGGIKDL